MVHDLRLGEGFFAMLAGLDAKIAQTVAAAGCGHCQGPLYQANYERKPRGGLVAAAGEAFRLRHSLCCGREGCRKRATPPSLRFLGRRVYLEAVVLLASVVTQLTFALREARARTGVPGRTLRRWTAWWTKSFPGSSTWLSLRAWFRPPPPDESALPESLLAHLRVDLANDQSTSTLSDRCVLAARLLAPMTTLSVPDGSRFVRELGADLAAARFAQKMSITVISSVT
ncbi:MAG: hypothetical protein KIT58_20395 [Planctomycetota bacterium]|nr:hypothetical protein [Planctomycetota bacterium]